MAARAGTAGRGFGGRQTGGTVSRLRHGENAEALGMLAARLGYERESLIERLLAALDAQQQSPPRPHFPAGPEYPMAASVVPLRRWLSQAFDLFVCQLADPATPTHAVHERFRRIGVLHARAGGSLESLRSGFQLATTAVWRCLQAAADELRLPPGVLGIWLAAALEFLDSLCERSVLGYRQGSRPLRGWRQRLLDTILWPEHHPAWLLGKLAATGNWPVPQQLLAIAVRATPGVPLPSTSSLPACVLGDLRRAPGVLLCPAPLDEQVRAALADAFAGHTIALGCPVRLVDAAASLRWATRCLELLDCGVLEHRPVLDCAEHRALLWLHAEPLLRKQLGHAVLAPLLEQAPHTRRILAETMLAWLETRGSAPALAARLGKHAQTVRYRLRRLHEIFGPDLQDAERCFEIYLVLRASMPLWQAGSADELMSQPARPGRRRSGQPAAELAELTGQHAVDG